MVSTRGGKYKFQEGEKVLCYEPDPTKAKVLYDSKVLEIVSHRDSRGRKIVEYLIHFQGWNSSWDRLVPEEYVLKDTEENRQLQRDLAQKAQLQIKKKNKYRGLRTMSATTGSSEDGSSEHHEDYDSEDVPTEEESECTSEEVGETSEDDSAAGSQAENNVKIELDYSSGIKRLLEHDYDLIVNKKKLLSLPMHPNVYEILEAWVQFYTVNQLISLAERPQRSKASNNIDKTILDKTVSDINICRQAADGLRIYFDMYLSILLLYGQEKEQFLNINMKAMPYPEFNSLKDDTMDNDITIKDDTEDTEFAHLPPFQEQEAEPEKNSTKRVLRSSRISSNDDSKGRSILDDSKQEGNLSSLASTSSRCSSPRIGNLRTTVPVINSVLINSILEKCKKWQLMPDDAKKEAFLNSKPSMIYGAPHLLRLLVKIPDIFVKTNIRGTKLKVLLKKITSLMSYIEDHKDWFDDQIYFQKINAEVTNNS